VAGFGEDHKLNEMVNISFASREVNRFD